MTTKSWDKIPLGEVLRKNEETIEIATTDNYQQVTVRLWGKGVVPRGEVSGMELASGRRFHVSAGQFIMSRTDARHGAFGIVPEELDGAIATNDFPSFNIDQTRLSPRFLGWLSQTHKFVELCRAASEGTTNRVRLQGERFLRMLVSLPEKVEQDRIVAKLDALVAKIEEAKRLQSNITEEVRLMLMSLHHHASSDRIVEVGSLLELYENHELTEPTKEYPQVGIRSFGGGLFDKSAVLGLGTTYKHFNRLEKGMVVLSQVKGWEGAIAICPSELEGYYASPEYRTFRCVEGQCHLEYMKHLIRTSWFHEHLATSTRGQGARRERTRPEMFLALRIPMPTYQQQGQAVKLLDRLESIRPFAAEIETEFAAMLLSILDKAFNGEL